jgi:hypothetical protein
MTQLESLPNDLLLDLFEYFDTVHLLHVFSGLNYRFHVLIYQHFRAYHLDLRRISKYDFDTLCQQYLRAIADRIVSCHLADKDETPGLLNLFYSRGFSINQFINLKSLTLHHIYGRNIVEMLDGLIHLVYLSISKCNISPEAEGVSHTINRIWSRPKLTHCKLENSYVSGTSFNGNTWVSATLEHLSIHYTGHTLTYRELPYLFLCTPHLRVLSLYLELLTKKENENLPVIVTSITTLNLVLSGEARLLGNLLQSMPDLRHLTVDLQNSKLNGHEWKQIIIKHVPKLKVLRFKMNLDQYDRHTSDQQANELLDTFRTPFWLHEHQWYVRCDWYHGRLYTLPYAFHLFTNIATDITRSQWTCPDIKKYWLFDRVHTLDGSTGMFTFLMKHNFRKIHNFL